MKVGFEILQPGPWRSWVESANLPCCTFVACFLRECLAPGSVQPPYDWRIYFAQDTTWWKLANVIDSTQPWSALKAAYQLWNGPVARYAPTVGRQDAPALRHGWNVVQRWRNLSLAGPGLEDDSVDPGRSTGHTYLAHLAPDGLVTIVQSSEAKGFRADTGSWSGTAGLDGYSVAVQPIDLR